MKKFKINYSKKLGSGGEGAVYEIENEPNLVAKIFHKKNSNDILTYTNTHFKKLPEAYVKPIELIENNGHIEGFIMDYIDNNHYIPISGLKYEKNCNQIGFKSTDKVFIFKTIKTNIISAHNIGIIIGDLNGENILVNKKNKNVKFVDITGYQTPYKKLDNYFLQPEITDWLNNYSGISESTDAYAYACLSYEILTGCHPFKGNHPRITGTSIEKLKQRSINKLSILGNHGINVPKSHTPIQTEYIKDQYFNIFEKGERFFINFDRPIQILKPTIINVKSTSKFQIKTLYGQDIIDYTYSNDSLIINDMSFVFNGRGSYINDKRNQKFTSSGKFFEINQDSLISNGVKIANVDLSNLRVKQIKNNLFTFNQNTAYIIDIEAKSGNNLSTTSKDFFGKSAKIVTGGIVQNFGGLSILQISKQNKINTFTFNANILDYYQINDDIMCCKYKEKNIIKYGYYDANNNGKLLYEIDADHIKKSAIKNDFIFEPTDDKIIIRRKQDFAVISEWEVDIVNNNSHLIFCKGGLLIINHNSAHLLNNN
jgi:serine/threonine protein kinase